MNVWCLCVLGLFVLSIGSSEGSRFKQNYPDYKSYQYQWGQSKANRWKSNQALAEDDQSPDHPPIPSSLEPSTHQPLNQHPPQQPHISPQQQPHISPQHPHAPLQQQPLSSQVGYLEYVVIILFGAVLVYIQIQKFNRDNGQPKKDVNEIGAGNSSGTSEEEVDTKEVEVEGEGGTGEKTKEVDKKVEADEENKLENVVEEREQAATTQVQEETEVGDTDTNSNNEATNNDGPQGTEEEEEEAEKGTAVNSIERIEDGDKKELSIVNTTVDSDEDWIVVNQDGTTSNCIRERSSSKSGEEDDIVDGESESEEMQLAPYTGQRNNIRDLNTMFEKLHIRPDPDAPLRDKLEMAKIIQTERKLMIKQAQFTSSLSVKKRSLELQKRREERSRVKELQRQDSVKEEIYKEQMRDDEYHKMIILHISVGIMLAIWLKVMDFSLFTLPFLAFPSSASSAFSSYLPTSFSLFYNLASWVTTARLFYALFLLVLFVFLWVFVSSLAPYVVLLFAFMHAWQSFFRAGIYFFFLWLITSLSFSLMRRARFMCKHKTLKLTILYTTHLALAALVGGVVAHGDPLNPYRIHFFPDSFAEEMFSYLY